MATDEVPAVPRRGRFAKDHRPSAAAAWAAAWDHLGAYGRAVARDDLIDVMQGASPVTHRTARETLQQAVTEGLLEVVSRDRYGRPTLKRPT